MLDTFQVDHVQPVAGGGGNAVENLAYACGNCNNRKQATTTVADPEAGQAVPLFNPRTDRWTDHFAWGEDYLTVVGQTPTGRATVARLHLNRPGAVNVRRAVMAMGEGHPPADTLPEDAGLQPMGSAAVNDLTGDDRSVDG